MESSPDGRGPAGSWVPTETQISAGGVAYRRQGERVDVALISVGHAPRWQLPKGMVDEGETREAAALREVREEAGITAGLVEPIDQVEYWFYASRDGQRVRFHKFVYFFLMEYQSGDVGDHDHEVNEARWVEIRAAQKMLTFDSDRKMVAIAEEKIRSMEP